MATSQERSRTMAKPSPREALKRRREKWKSFDAILDSEPNNLRESVMRREIDQAWAELIHCTEFYEERSKALGASMRWSRRILIRLQKYTRDGYMQTNLKAVIEALDVKRNPKLARGRKGKP